MLDLVLPASQRSLILLAETPGLVLLPLACRAHVACRRVPAVDQLAWRAHRHAEVPPAVHLVADLTVDDRIALVIAELARCAFPLAHLCHQLFSRQVATGTP